MQNKIDRPIHTRTHTLAHAGGSSSQLRSRKLQLEVVILALFTCHPRVHIISRTIRQFSSFKQLFFCQTYPFYTLVCVCIVFCFFAAISMTVTRSRLNYQAPVLENAMFNIVTVWRDFKFHSLIKLFNSHFLFSYRKINRSLILVKFNNLVLMK